MHYYLPYFSMFVYEAKLENLIILGSIKTFSVYEYGYCLLLKLISFIIS